MRIRSDMKFEGEPFSVHIRRICCDDKCRRLIPVDNLKQRTVLILIHNDQQYLFRPHGPAAGSLQHCDAAVKFFLNLLPDLIPLFRYDLHTLGNGSFPERLIALVEEGLVDRVAVDIKNSPALYAKTVGLEHFDMGGVERTKDLLLSDPVEYEFRTTVVRGLHTRESLIEAARWIAGAREYYLQQFKDSGALLSGAGLGAFDGAEMHALADAVRPWVPCVQVRGVE